MHTKTLWTGVAAFAVAWWVTAPLLHEGRAKAIPFSASNIHDSNIDRNHSSPVFGHHRCHLTYVDGTTQSTASCDNVLCADIETALDCQDTLGEGDCNLIDACDCDYQRTEIYEHTDWEEDTLLTGIPNLWQFDYGCGLGGDNAIGCGIVAPEMIFYWWAQQGYDGLVEDFLVGSGDGPAEREHDWKAFGRVLRDDYFSGGICVPGGQYAVPQGTLENGLDAYLQDAGYTARVDHYRVCSSCAAGGATDLSKTEGLTEVKGELRAGRPVIIGMNSGKTLKSHIDVYDPVAGDAVRVYTGKLSNGTPAFGTIDHYAVVTGYRELNGMDVLSLNFGWGNDPDPSQDILVEWNPGGKWLHLFTVDITSPPDGTPWCALDRGLSASFTADRKLELSHDSLTPDIPLAGVGCGIVRDSSVWYEYETYDVGYTCWTGGRLPDIDDVPVPGGGDFDPRGGGMILDELDPLP